MSIFSDSPINQDEFDRYLKELNKTDEVIEFLMNSKFDELTKFYSKGLTDKDINDMIARKNSRKKVISVCMMLLIGKPIY